MAPTDRQHRILSFLAEHHGPSTAGEIDKHLGLPAGAARRTLRTLQTLGAVEIVGTGPRNAHTWATTTPTPVRSDHPDHPDHAAPPAPYENHASMVWLERPYLFTCRDELGRNYIALLVESDLDAHTQTLLYLRASVDTLGKLRTGQRKLRPAFAQPASGYLTVMVVTYDLNRSATHDTYYAEPAAIDEQWLPSPGTICG